MTMPTVIFSWWVLLLDLATTDDGLAVHRWVENDEKML